MVQNVDKYQAISQYHDPKYAIKNCDCTGRHFRRQRRLINTSVVWCRRRRRGDRGRRRRNDRRRRRRGDRRRRRRVT